MTSATTSDGQTAQPHELPWFSTALLHVPRMLRFGVVGMLGVGVNTLVLYLLVAVTDSPAWIGAIVSAEVALIHNFALNSWWTFRGARTRTGLVSRFVRYNLICGGAIGITVGVVWVLTTWTDVHYLLANLVGIGCGFAWNYGLNVLFTWSVAPVRTAPD